MKLAICIPAFNEEKTIGQVIRAVPGHFAGIREVKIFVADDGSTDKTAEVARVAGAERALGDWREVESGSGPVEIIRIHPNKGLANAFLTAIRQAVTWGADFVVNIDADGQYRPEEIPLLLAPLLKGEADMSVGDRQVGTLRFMPFAKKYGNIAGSWFLRVLTGLRVSDASSGFRAYTRAAAQAIEVHSQHTYTHENLIQAHYSGLRIAQMPITFIARADGTASRLIRGGRTGAAGGTDAAGTGDSPSGFGSVLNHIFKSLRGIFAAWRRWRRKKR